MNEINQSNELEKQPIYSENFEHERPAIKVALFVLWRIHNKKYLIGNRLFESEISPKLKTTKTNYKEALLFLEGAGAVVNEVIITASVPKELVERYGIKHG